MGTRLDIRLLVVLRPLVGIEGCPLVEEVDWVSNLAVRYGGVWAVRSVSFTVAPGHSVGLIGANGAGKTSTLRALMGLTPRAAGELRFGDRDLSTVPARDMVRLGIGYVPEGRHVFPGLSVEKNLLLGAYARRWDGTTRETLGSVYDLFPVLGEMRGRLAGALSGGQQQMLAIGRALMARPACCCPTSRPWGCRPSWSRPSARPCAGCGTRA